MKIKIKATRKGNLRTVLTGTLLAFPLIVLAGCHAGSGAGRTPERLADGALDQVAQIAGNLAGGFLNSSSSYFNQYESSREKDDYLVSGRVFQKDDDNARLCFVKTEGTETVAIRGTMEREKGDIKLIYEAPDGTETVLADSNGSSRDLTDIDTELELEDGIGLFRFDGTNATFRFDLAFSGCSSRNVSYLTSYNGGDTEESTAPSVEEAPAEEDGESLGWEETGPEESLLGSCSHTLTDVAKPYTVLTLDFEEPTTAWLEADLRAKQTDGGALSLGRFRLTCEDESGRSFTIAEHDTADFALGGFFWSTSCSKEITFPAGRSKVVLSSVNGKNYEIGLDVMIYESR